MHVLACNQAGRCRRKSEFTLDLNGCDMECKKLELFGCAAVHSVNDSIQMLKTIQAIKKT